MSGRTLIDDLDEHATALDARIIEREGSPISSGTIVLRMEVILGSRFIIPSEYHLAMLVATNQVLQ